MNETVLDSRWLDTSGIGRLVLPWKDVAYLSPISHSYLHGPFLSSTMLFAFLDLSL